MYVLRSPRAGSECPHRQGGNAHQTGPRYALEARFVPTLLSRDSAVARRVHPPKSIAKLLIMRTSKFNLQDKRRDFGPLLVLGNALPSILGFL